MHAPISVHATHSFEPAASPTPKRPTEVPTVLPPGDGTRGWHHWRCGVLRSALRSWAAVSRGAVAYMLAKAAEHFGAAVHARRRRLDRRGWGGDGAGRIQFTLTNGCTQTRPELERISPCFGIYSMRAGGNRVIWDHTSSCAQRIVCQKSVSDCHSYHVSLTL